MDRGEVQPPVYVASGEGRGLPRAEDVPSAQTVGDLSVGRQVDGVTSLQLADVLHLDRDVRVLLGGDFLAVIKLPIARGVVVPEGDVDRGKVQLPVPTAGERLLLPGAEDIPPPQPVGDGGTADRHVERVACGELAFALDLDPDRISRRNLLVWVKLLVVVIVVPEDDADRGQKTLDCDVFKVDTVCRAIAIEPIEHLHLGHVAGEGHSGGRELHRVPITIGLEALAKAVDGHVGFACRVAGGVQCDDDLIRPASVVGPAVNNERALSLPLIHPIAVEPDTMIRPRIRCWRGWQVIVPFAVTSGFLQDQLVVQIQRRGARWVWVKGVCSPIVICGQPDACSFNVPCGIEVAIPTLAHTQRGPGVGGITAEIIHQAIGIVGETDRHIASGQIPYFVEMPALESSAQCDIAIVHGGAGLCLRLGHRPKDQRQSQHQYDCHSYWNSLAHFAPPFSRRLRPLLCGPIVGYSEQQFPLWEKTQVVAAISQSR